MKPTRLLFALSLAALPLGLAAADSKSNSNSNSATTSSNANSSSNSHNDSNSTSIAFSDASKPGTIRVQLVRGDIKIQGADVTEVTVRSDAKAVTRAPRADGMRVLSAASSFGLAEKDNVITLDAGDGWKGGGSDFTLTVPKSTNIVISNANFGGDVTCTNIAGDVEVECLHGEVKLDGVSGGVLVTTLNGEIKAKIAQVSDKKPLSFSSMNGEVELILPAAAKGNVKLRTQNGTILTNFPETALVTKVENTGAVPEMRSLSFKSRDELREAARVSADAVREATDAIKEATASIRAGIDDSRAEGRSDGKRSPDVAITARAPRKPIPPITGGKLVTGALNGGGSEISVVTMNGDVTLRKNEQ